jgi:hypothetical protein
VAAVPVRVCLEQGPRWTFASALDWPGWCRRARGDEPALEALLNYADRYAAVAGPGFTPGELEVVATVPGDATTDFGAPSAPAPGEEQPLAGSAGARLVVLLLACWEALDRAAAGAPAQLRKGPRGGGRDRDAVLDHVREAERSYARKVGVRLPPGTPWPVQRAQVRAALLAPPGPVSWPVRYALRRTAWHVLDHAWEIEDRAG